MSTGVMASATSASCQSITKTITETATIVRMCWPKKIRP